MQTYRFCRGYYGIPTGTEVEVRDQDEATIGIVARYTDSQQDDVQVVTRLTRAEAGQYLEAVS